MKGELQRCELGPQGVSSQGRIGATAWMASGGAAAAPRHERRSDQLAWGWEWTKRLGAVGGAQIVVQGVGFLTGILIVRMLPTSEYALYTLANTLLGTMTVLSDAGISSGVMAEGGKVWSDRARLGAVVATGLRLRRRFALWSVMVGVPVLGWLLRSHGAGWPETMLLLAATGAFCWFAYLGSIYGLAPSLWQRLRETQRISIEQNVGRFVGSGAALLVLPSAAMAVLATLAAQFWAAIRLRHVSGEIIGRGHREDPTVRAAVLTVVRRILPVSIYFCLSSQLTIWLISLRGSTTSLAQVGALGRLGQIFTVFSALVAMVIVPRFARLAPVRSLILRRYFQAMALLILAGAGVTGLVALFPREALWILGQGYAGLTSEAELAMVASLVYFLAKTAASLGNARGIVVHPALGIGLQVVWQILCIGLLDVGTVRGVLWLGILVPGFELALYTVNLMARRPGEAPAIAAAT